VFLGPRLCRCAHGHEGGGLRKMTSVSGATGGGAPPAKATELAAEPRMRLRVPAALIVAAVLFGIWEVAVRAAKVPAFVLPPPSTVVRDLAAEPGLFARAVGATLGEAAGGLALATVAALTFAVGAVHPRRFDRLVTPLVVVSQTIPVITLAPLLILWFGYGALPRVVVCALVAFFPMAITILEGLRSTDPDLLLLLRSLDASRLDTFWRVRLPNAGPFLAAAARTGVTLCLVGAVVAEWTGAGHGLGYLVLSANSRLATGQALAAVLLMCLLGLAAYGGVGVLERRIGWWNQSTSRMRNK
jgi:ABC-type nitrate/sulfonate/bicarbonate transport system permease component